MDFSIKKNWKRGLLTVENAKTSKGESLGVLTGILYLAPADESVPFGGRNMCPKASKGCAAACLFNSGRGRFEKVKQARIAKTLYFLNDKENFMADLDNSIRRIIKIAKRTGMKPAIRLNGTSDEPVHTWGFAEKYPDVVFYNYTKVAKYIWDYVNGKLPPNYHLTFSKSEENQHEVAEIINDSNVNVAVVFSSDNFPETYMGRKVVDGTLHDCTFLQPSGVILGLKASGKAKKDTTGFVVPTA